MAQCLVHSKGSVSGLVNTFLLYKKGLGIPGMVANTLNPSLGRQKQVDLCEFEVSKIKFQDSQS